MAIVEGWLVVTPKRHVYLYCEDVQCDKVLGLPWHILEEESLLLSFLTEFKSDFDPAITDPSSISLPVSEITELKLKAQWETLRDWFNAREGSIYQESDQLALTL